MSKNSVIMRVSPKFRRYLKNYKEELDGDIQRSGRSGIPFTKLTEYIVDEHKESRKNKKKSMFDFRFSK